MTWWVESVEKVENTPTSCDDSLVVVVVVVEVVVMVVAIRHHHGSRSVHEA